MENGKNRVFTTRPLQTSSHTVPGVNKPSCRHEASAAGLLSLLSNLRLPDQQHTDNAMKFKGTSN
ncbi:hypothetical protein CCHR01_03241 [Colletotrichum chrysophilum]|uniref:Uncharacterized protein n=1 Tax=Colletotrichum chrysophilum TaxID=1836956 RepID=A0AAD9AUA8_9PEZI|nr:hypothetical protein CCHR01_03241 [Colletotrichum chrysophilum]